MEGKNKIIVYRDWIEIFEPLEDVEAGKLIKHFFRYVNDKKPEAPDRLTALLFDGSLKPTLKRDLKKWHEIAGKRSEAGKISAEKRKQQEATKTTSVKSVEQTSTNPTVKDNVIVKVNDNVNDILLEKETKYNFKRSLIGLGVDPQIASDWMAVRQKKKATNTETAFKGLLLEIEKSKLPPNECIKIAVEMSWAGFKSEWINNKKNETSFGNNTGSAKTGTSKIGSDFSGGL